MLLNTTGYNPIKKIVFDNMWLFFQPGPFQGYSNYRSCQGLTTRLPRKGSIAKKRDGIPESRHHPPMWGTPRKATECATIVCKVHSVWNICFVCEWYQICRYNMYGVYYDWNICFICEWYKICKYNMYDLIITLDRISSRSMKRLNF